MQNRTPKGTLMLHAGCNRVSIKELASVPTPRPTRTHHPIAHDQLRLLVMAHLAKSEFNVTSQEHGLSANKQVYFGLLNVTDGLKDDEFSFAIGLRNSHNKTLRAGLVAGTRVFVCDNLAFTGGVVMFRTHTSLIEDDISPRIGLAIDKVRAEMESFKNKADRMRTLPVDDRMAHHVIMEAARAELLPENLMMPVLREWHEPSFDAFKPRTAWSLWNGFTHVQKQQSFVRLPERGRDLESLFARLALN